MQGNLDWESLWDVPWDVPWELAAAVAVLPQVAAVAVAAIWYALCFDSNSTCVRKYTKFENRISEKNNRRCRARMIEHRISLNNSRVGTSKHI